MCVLLHVTIWCYKRINWFSLGREYKNNLNNNNTEKKRFPISTLQRHKLCIILLYDLLRFSIHYHFSPMVISLHSHHWFISSSFFLFVFVVFAPLEVISSCAILLTFSGFIIFTTMTKVTRGNSLFSEKISNIHYK